MLVVFGASGDLTHRKLLPALERLSRRRLLAPAFAIVGVARSEMSDDGFRELMLDAVPAAGPGWAEIVKSSVYISGEYSHPDTFAALQDRLKEIDESLGTGGTGPTTWRPSPRCSVRWPRRSGRSASTSRNKAVLLVS